MGAHGVTVGWFEIPVLDMERAMRFYSGLFSCEFQRMQMGPIDMAMFPWNEEMKGAGGSLVFDGETKPAQGGLMVYFSSEDVNIELARIESLGGQILLPKTLIAEEFGYMAVFMDSEGNRVSLHSQK